MSVGIVKAQRGKLEKKKICPVATPDSEALVVVEWEKPSDPLSQMTKHLLKAEAIKAASTKCVLF